ncbi:hypothetical protein SARC_07566 [Sphaeroforma arctica JP610]|uniref:Uncharacterized protein n=1 Tax=Sphaeroforma arctica JP610 TaxID=667725 RepID=A0A0L0FTD6_9EUKA|nr:hypothetical protein SARC_07566 [Sphaeroforma arctica JP610]KNC80057.1 hypothetical protein SARC_07566 [Sphaeroforma arctica JP610]|eukprot:XP_014153959.1 hypothetical protein SARC_07566 [Sphaeroforma arctica JP610]
MVASGIAVVTGANQGIGYHIARLIATKGYKTYLACRREKEGQRVAQELRDAGLDTHFVQLDINDQGKYQFFYISNNKNGGDNPMSKSNYGMSKCGVIALVKLLAAEEKQRAPTDGSASIFYTCFCPGYCSTSMSSHIGPRSAEKGAGEYF